MKDVEALLIPDMMTEEKEEKETKEDHPAMKEKHTSPLKQFKKGIKANDVECKEGLELLINSHSGEPACVSSTAANKLVERGWGQLP